MDIQIVRGDNAAVLVGGEWCVEFFICEDDYTVDSDPTLVVTMPDGTTDTPTYETPCKSGTYLYRIDVSQVGRLLAVISADEVLTRAISAEALAVTTNGEMPNAADVLAYVGQSSLGQEVVNGALEAEKAAQRARCRIPAAYPADLREALLRRVQRNLSMRGLPTAGDANDFGVNLIPTNDPEVRRLEAPYRKVILA